MGKVAAVPPTAKFLESVQASGLLSAEAFAKVTQKHASAADAPTVARALISDGLLTRWQASQLLNGFFKLVVGKYKLLEQLSANETGRMFLAEHAGLNRRVALKVLAARLTSKPEVVKRFLAEARVAASIDHRNIVHVYDVVRETDRTYLVSEYFAGQDLSKLVAGGSLTPDRALNITRQIADGLAQAHEQKICHGGLRPSTVLVDSQGTAKITDLGVGSLAESVSPTGLDESTELPVDVLAYSAPEGSGPTPTSDIFALGGILYLLLTGEPPVIAWRAENGTPVGKEILAALKRKAAAAPEDLLKLCAMMLAPKPTDRPPSVEGVQKALELMQNKVGAKLPLKSADPAKAPAKVEKVDSSGGMPKISINVGDKPTPKVAAKEPAKPMFKEPAAKEPAGKEPAKAAPAAGKLVKAKPLAASGANPVVKTKPQSQPKVEEEEPFLLEAVVEVEEETVDVAAEGDAEDTFPGFVVNTSPKQSGGFPALHAGKAPAKPAVETAADTAPAGPAPATSKLPLILGLSIGGGVLALGGIIGLVLMLSGGGSKKKELAANIARAEKEKAEQEAEKPAEVETSSNPNPSANPNPNPNPSVNPVPENPNPVPAIDPTQLNPAPVEPPPAEPPPAEPMPEVKPVEPPPMPMPPPKEKPKGNPFEGFPKFVTLPSLGTKNAVPAEALQEFKLGPAKLGGVECYVDLFGGDGAFKGKQRFVLEAGNGGTSTTDWAIKLQMGEADSAPIVVAKVTAKEDTLFFQWQSAAVDAAAAPHLCNCLIRLRAGAGTHSVALRAPLSGDPLVLTTAKAISGRWTVDFNPDPAKCKVELLSVEGGVAGHRFEKRAFTFEANDPGIVWLGMTPTDTPLAVVLKSTLGKQLQFTGSFHAKTEQEQKPQPFNRKAIESAKQKMIFQVQQSNFAIEQNKNAPGNPEQKKQFAAQMSADIAKAQKAASDYETVINLYDALKSGATLNFRVFYETGETGADVTLISTKG